MTVSEMIRELEEIKSQQGDIPVVLQDDGNNEEKIIMGHETFFIVPEEYEEGWIVNLRWWPY